MFIKKILQETLTYGIENKATIFHTLKFPSLGILITSLLINEHAETFTILDTILVLIHGYFYIIFTIYCHRTFLEKETPNGLIDILKWDKRKTNFLLTTIALAIGTSICIVPIFFILIMFGNSNSEQFNHLILLSILMLPIGYVFSRFSLILPAAAIDKDNSWSIAWHLSRGNGWNLCLLISFLPIISNFILNNINSTSLITKAFATILSLIVLFYEVSILSNSYKVLIEKNIKPNT